MLRILVVEDHEIVRDALAGWLAGTPDVSVVGVASTLREAVPLLEQHDPNIVLADLVLSDGSAVELVRTIRRSRLHGRVFVITGFGDGFAAADALAQGAAGYALKAQPAAEILEAIRIVGQGGRYVAPEVAAKLMALEDAADRPADPWHRPNGLELLSRREHEVLRQVVEGYATREIARRLCISPKTVGTHRTTINKKLAVRTTADLVRFAVAHGIAVVPRSASPK
jgi:DNA-binding NarL/FixJ family response regulator